MNIKKLFVCLGLILSFSGCLSDPYMSSQNPYSQNANYNRGGQHNKQKLGTIGGAAGGAILGSHILGSNGFNGSMFGAVFGGLLGGMAGNRAGAYLDARADQKMSQTAYYALNNGQINSEYKWNSGEHNGSFVPTRDYYLSNKNMYCREFYQTINIGGSQKQAYGTACRMPDGAWKIMN